MFSTAPQPRTVTRRRGRRTGFSATLAMLFLVLFSTLAVGFYAATNTAMQTSVNDQRILLAQTAAEAGMEIIRYNLGHVSIPPNTPPTTPYPADTLLKLIYNGNGNSSIKSLYKNLVGQRILGGHSISLVNNVLYIPDSGTIALDATGQSRCAMTITMSPGGDVVVKSQGYYANTSSGGGGSRAITMDFTTSPIPPDSFNYAIASKGQVVISKGTISMTNAANASQAQVMSDAATAGAISMSGGTVGGDLNIISGATAAVTGGTVDGVSNRALIVAQHVHVVSPPEFPIVDTTVYAPYATNAYVPGAALQQNIVIPPNTNPKFNANDTVQGIMYVQSPNIVTFRGDFKLQGLIVFENAGTTAQNALNFSGNVTMSPLPAGTQFDSLRSVSGVAMLAPTAAISMSGSNDSSVKGNMILGSFSMAGASNVYIDSGTLMTMNTGSSSMVMNGSKQILFTAIGATNEPNKGVYYNAYFTAKANTYQEILP